jgi:hypothetical protein
LSTNILGFGHKLKQGKDTAAEAIIKARGGLYDVRRYAFADELKREYVRMCEETGSTYEMIQVAKVRHNAPSWVDYELGADLEDPICGKHGKQRKFLQWLGNYRREQDSMYWVKKVARAILNDQPQFALVTDVRYPNEAAWIKLCGGNTVKVSREGYNAGDEHVSENALNDYAWDYALRGEDGKKEELEALAVAFFDFFVSSLNPKPVSTLGGGLVLAA